MNRLWMAIKLLTMAIAGQRIPTLFHALAPYSHRPSSLTPHKGGRLSTSNGPSPGHVWVLEALSSEVKFTALKRHKNLLSPPLSCFLHACCWS